MALNFPFYNFLDVLFVNMTMDFFNGQKTYNNFFQLLTNKQIKNGFIKIVPRNNGLRYFRRWKT